MVAQLKDMGVDSATLQPVIREGGHIRQLLLDHVHKVAKPATHPDLLAISRSMTAWGEMSTAAISALPDPAAGAARNQPADEVAGLLVDVIAECTDPLSEPLSSLVQNGHVDQETATREARFLAAIGSYVAIWSIFENERFARAAWNSFLDRFAEASRWPHEWNEAFDRYVDCMGLESEDSWEPTHPSFRQTFARRNGCASNSDAESAGAGILHDAFIATDSSMRSWASKRSDTWASDGGDAT